MIVENSTYEQYQHGYQVKTIMGQTFKYFFFGLLWVGIISAAMYFVFGSKIIDFADTYNTTDAAPEGALADGASKSLGGLKMLGIVSIVLYIATSIAFWVMSSRMHRTRTSTLMVWYGLYATVSGITLGSIMIFCRAAFGDFTILTMAIGSASAVFGLAWLVGTKIKTNLAPVAMVAMICMFVLVIFDLVAYFAFHGGNKMMNIGISSAFIVIITIFIMFKIQRMKALEGTQDGASLQKLSIIMAWSLLGDFISLIIQFIRLYAAINRR